MEKLEYKKESLLADKNEVLDISFLSPIWEIISKLEKGESVDWLTWWDKIKSWYDDYKVMYSYSDKYNLKTPKQLEIIQEINSKKDNSDLMNLVEISIWRLLEKYFSEAMPWARVRKTTLADDYFWSIDYIIEFKWNDWKIVSVMWVDLTVLESLNDYELERRLFEKKAKKVTKPLDYIWYLEWTWRWTIRDVPRLVLHFNKDIAYHFTNNYFADVFEKWKLLTSEEVTNNLEYAIDDYNDFQLSNFKKGIDINNIDNKIISLIDQSKRNISSIIN